MKLNFLFFILCISSTAFAGFDPTYYLTLTLESIKKTSDENVLEDLYGNKLSLDLNLNDSELFADVAASYLFESIGLPTLSVYPVFFNRGSGSWTLNPQYSPALLRALPQNKVEFSFKELTPNQKAEFLIFALLHYASGNSHPHISFTGSHLFSSSLGKSFVNLERKSLRDFLAFFEENLKPLFQKNEDANNKVDEKSLQQFLEAVNTLLSRLENLSLKKLEKLMSFYSSSPQVTKSTQELTETLSHNLSLLRSVLNRKLQGFSEQKPSKKDRPHLRLPNTRSKNGLYNKNSTELLWSLFFTKNSRLRKRKIKQLAVILGVEEKKVIPTLIGKVQQDSPKNYFISPLDKSTAHSLSPNSLNSKTLVVVPKNDSEAYAIIEIAKKSEAHVLEIDAGHGVKLTQEHIDLIMAQTAEHQIERVLIVEMPGEKVLLKGKTTEENTLRRQVQELIIVDHHNYFKQRLFRKKARSSFEQVAHILGLNMTFDEYLIAVNDRSFIPGLLLAGQPKSQLYDTILKNPFHKFIHSRIKNLQPVKTKLGPLYLVNGEDVPGKIGSLAAVLSVMSYPNIPNLLVIGADEFRYSGSPVFEETLTHITSEYEESMKSHYSGGDKSLSVFWGAKGIPDEVSPDLLAKISQELEINPETTNEILAEAKTIREKLVALHAVVDFLKKVFAEEKKTCSLILSEK